MIRRLDTFSARLRKAMERAGMSNAELARRLSVTDRSVTRWVNDKARPKGRPKEIEISGVLGVNPRWLFEDDYDGPMLQESAWAYDASREKITHRQVAAMYDRLDEIMKAMDLNKERLAAAAGLRRDLDAGKYWLGDRPDARDIKKIADATGHDPDWIWSGQKNRLSKAAPYTQAKEAMRPPADGRGDASNIDAGSYGAPDLSGQAVVQTLAPTNEWYIQAVREILASGEHATVNALKSNVEQFREQIRDKAWQRNLIEQNQVLVEQNRELNERVAELEREIKKEPASRDPSTKSKKKHPKQTPKAGNDENLQSSGNT